MKIFFILPFVALSFFTTGCSGMKKIKSHKKSDDVGSFSASGSMMLYFRHDENIYLRVCPVDTSYLINTSAEKIKAGCSGSVSKEIRIPVPTFYSKVRAHLSPLLGNLEKAMIPEEIDHNYEARMSQAQTQFLESALAQVNSFIQTYGAEDARQFSVKELAKLYKETSTHHRAFNLISDEVSRAIDNITAQRSLTLVRSSTKQELVLHKIFKDYNVVEKKACGLSGSIKDRITDCAKFRSSRDGNIVLVTRTRKYFEVYKDQRTGALWTDIVNGLYDYRDAVKRCRPGLAEAGLPSVKWRLPTKEDYLKARRSQILTKWDNGESWTATAHARRPAMAWANSDLEDRVELKPTDEDLKVRCIAN